MFCASLICGGALLAGKDTLHSDWFGYMLVIVNNLLSSLYSVFVAWNGRRFGIKSFETNYFIAFVSLPILLVDTLLRGYLDSFWANPHIGASGFLFWVGLSSVSGVLINVLTVAVSMNVSPVALNLTGTARSIGLTAVGFLCFNDVQITQNLVGGLALSFSGAFTYSYIQLQRLRANVAEEKNTKEK